VGECTLISPLFLHREAEVFFGQGSLHFIYFLFKVYVFNCVYDFIFELFKFFLKKKNVNID
jgi:hypothetical protein